MPQTVLLVLQLIESFPQDLAAVETFISSVSSTWSESDKQAVQDALNAAKAKDDTDTATMNSAA